MSKVMKVVFGIIIAVFLFLVIILGVKAFYPEPDYKEYNGEYGCNELRQNPMTPCLETMSGTECSLHQELENKKYQDSIDEIAECNEKWEDRRNIYERNIFFIYNILGVILLIISFLTISTTHISAGTALAGLVLSMSGFSIGWRSTNDMLKFVFGLIMLGIIIWLIHSMNKKLENNSN